MPGRLKREPSLRGGCLAAMDRRGCPVMGMMAALAIDHCRKLTVGRGFPGSDVALK